MPGDGNCPRPTIANQGSGRSSPSPARTNRVLSAISPARQAGLITPVLVGPAAKIHAIAAEHDIDLADTEIVDAAALYAGALRRADPSTRV